jgi:hypothetical protein
MQETWMPLPGFPKYEATAQGSVRGPRKKVLRSFAYDSKRSSVRAVNLYRDEEMIRVTIPRIKRLLAGEAA